ncbi:hypothetical protein [Falsiroseomonas sp. E2-1-a20]|uniref:hypothetical protein n=1 Tax=Falsiroseomonas sp. E2-1-a20 TaxID=3239300 RepID=UPI003F38D5C2
MPPRTFKYAMNCSCATQLDLLLAKILAAAQRTAVAEPKHFERVTIDTTILPEAVTHLTDSKLIHRGIEMLSRLAAVCQFYTRIY